MVLGDHSIVVRRMNDTPLMNNNSTLVCRAKFTAIMRGFVILQCACVACCNLSRLDCCWQLLRRWAGVWPAVIAVFVGYSFVQSWVAVLENACHVDADADAQEGDAGWCGAPPPALPLPPSSPPPPPPRV